LISEFAQLVQDYTDFFVKMQRKIEGTFLKVMTNFIQKFMLIFGMALLLLFIIFFTAIGYVNHSNSHKSGRPAHHAENAFRNPWPGFEDRDFGDFLKWQWNRLRGNAPNKPEHYDFRIIENNGHFLRENGEQFTVTWIGHATALIQIEGRNILTDPIFSSRCSPVSWAGPQRVAPPSPSFENLPPIDMVLISHNHYDHLDKPTIKRLGNRPCYFVPLLLAKFLQDLGIAKDRIVELDWWQSAELDGLKIHCTPTQHFSGRGLHDRNRTLWCSWTVIGERHRFYFGGDTGYFPGFKEIGEKLGPFDLAILPIGAYRPRWFMSPMHVDPAQSAQAFLDLRAEKMLAIHWGTFDLADEPMDEPPRLLRAAADSLDIDSTRVWILQHGETRVVEEKWTTGVME
jgi:N-acyl-phosphatidylethanolamine-hydrolysing phospholipase D